MTDTDVGKYRLIAELGHGGMADVFLAVTEGLSSMSFEKLVVIKRLREQVSTDPEFVAMLKDEARIAARLNHPNVLQTMEVGEADGQIFLSMEYLDGQPLHRILARARTTIPLNIHLAILCDVLSGLHYAHDLADYDGTPLHVVHRDATPHNVFVTYDGVVKVVDFGIAKAAGRISQTRHGVVKGKVPYMAPEQARSAILDRRADVFAVGVMLYEALTQQRYWKGVSELNIVSKLARGDIRSSPRDVEPNVSEALDAVCRKALTVKPEDRYSNAADFETALETVMTKEVGRPTKREIGKYISELFTDKREKTKQVIDAQLSELRHQRKPKVVTIEPIGPHTPVSGEVPTDVEYAPTELVDSLRIPLSKTPSERPGRTSDTAPAANRRKPPAPAPSSSSGRRIAILVALSLVAIVVLAVAIFLAKAKDAPPEMVSVTLKATPLETKFTIDDGADQENPFVGSFKKDGREHRVGARAPGYVSKTETVVFDRDVSVRFSLARDGVAPKASP